MTALVVEPLMQDRLLAVSCLTAVGFHVTAVDSFETAKERMAASHPAVLVSEICLGEFNGLHLVIRGQAVRRGMAAIVTCHRPDPVLQTEAEGMGATFVVKPVTALDLLAAVFRTLFRTEGDLRPVRPPYERRTGERRVRVAELRHPERRRGERRRDTAALLRPSERAN